MNHSWNIRRLGDICTSELGKTRDEKRNKGTFRPYLCAINVQWDRFDLSELKEMRFEDDEYDRYTIRKGDLVICEGGDIGRAAIWDNEQPIYYQNALHRVRFVKGIDARFILYYFMYLKQTGILDGRYGKGVTIKHLVKSTLVSIPVPVPPIVEQQRIVSELDLLNGIIDKKNAQLRDLDALAQSIFYEMFGNPVTNDKGWPKKRIGELVHLYNGRAFKPSEWTESGLPIVRIQNLNSPDSPYNCYDGVVDEAYLLKGGELLYAWSGTPGTSFGAHIWKGEKAVLNQHIFKVLFDEKYLNKLYFLYQLNLSVSSLFDQTHGGVGLKHITKGTLENQLVPLPNMELQNSFAQKVLAIDSEKDRLKCSLLQTKTLLESRMSEYFNTK